MFTESIGELPPGARVTGRCRRAAGAQVGSVRSVAAVAQGLPLSCPTMHAAFVAHAQMLPSEPDPPVVLGIDETRLGRPRWSRDGETGRWRRLDRFETNFVDLHQNQGLLGQTAGRTSAAVVAWLDERGADWKAGVRIVAIDPCAAYRSAVQRALPDALIVADHFHLVRLANEMVTDVRQRVAREQYGRRGRASDPAWANRRLLLAATERHTTANRLHVFHEAVLAADLPEATRLAHTVDAWRPQILGFLQTRITNAGTEGTNRMVKDAARIAFGFRNLDNQRRRVRFHCTRRSRRPASVEGDMLPHL